MPSDRDVLTSTHASERPAATEGLEQLAEMTALLNLFGFLGPSGLLPLPTDYSATPRTIHAMVAEILDAPTDLKILECGSGMSTVWLAAACRHAGHGSVVALEHADRYATETRKALSRCGLQDYATVVDAPLQRLDLGDRTFRWYDRRGFGGLDRVDVLFVDGPPGSTGPMARYPAFAVLRPLLSDGALIVVDDAQRSDESRTVEEWRAAAPGMGGALAVTARPGRALLLRWRPSVGRDAPQA